MEKTLQARRVLYVSTVPDTLSHFMLPLVQRLRASGARVEGAAHGILECTRCRSAFDAVHEVPWSRNPLDLWGLVRSIARIRKVVGSGGYDTVHVNSPIAAFVTRWALRRWRGEGRRIFYTAHGFHFFRGNAWYKNLVFSAMERIAARWTDRLFVINEEDRRAAVGMGGLQPEQIVWTPGIGVDLDVYQRIGSGEERVKRELGIESSRQYIIVVGEFIERKRHADFLRAFAKAQLADVDAVFAGRGRLEKRLRKLTAELGLEAKVHFAGYRSDIPRLVSTAVLLCLPSDQEGLPRCVLEAMAIGVPVVGTDIRGTRDLLGDGCGKLVPVGEVDMLALALREVCEDRDVASKLVAAASQRVKDFELRKVTCIYDRVYGVEGVDEVLG